MTRRLTLIRQVRVLVTFVMQLPYQYIHTYRPSVKYGNASCTWSSSYQQFALFVCDADRQSAGLSKLEYPSHRYVSFAASLYNKRGRDDTLLLLRDSTMF